MSALCFYFQVHQPYRLRHYTFFDIGVDSFYEDEDANCGIMLKVARKCYLPMNALLLKLIRKYDGRFKVSFSISGTALDQFEAYAPEVIQSFRELVATGCVELLSETYNHSLAFLYSPEEFREQVALHDERIEALFGVTPRVFRNTELIYNNDLARAVEAMGYKAVLAEGADHVLGWRSRTLSTARRGAIASSFCSRITASRTTSPSGSRTTNGPNFRSRRTSFPSGRTPPTPPEISSICSWITRRSGSINGNPPVFSPLWKPCPRSCCGRPVSRSSRLRKRRPGSSRWRASTCRISCRGRTPSAISPHGSATTCRTTPSNPSIAWRRRSRPRAIRRAPHMAASADLRPFLLHVHEVVLGR